MAHHDDIALPRPALISVAALVLLSLVFAAFARLTDVGTTRNPTSAPVLEASLTFEDRADGAVVVYHDGTRDVVEVYAPGTNGFIRGVLRGMARERMLRGVGPEPPFVLTRWVDGRHTLRDAATGRHVELDPFGPTNVGVFARLLVSATSGPQQEDHDTTAESALGEIASTVAARTEP